MMTVALIGGDGAGKTTIAKAVIQSCGLPMKYIYMGLSTRSNDRALPTSRLALFVKRRMYKNNATENSGSYLPDDIPAHQLEYSKQAHGWAWNTARFLNRLAEAWYRQLIATSYQIRGYLVIYDRHFFFDTAPGIMDSQGKALRGLDRLYSWLMNHWYPRPNLTIFLDAPPDLLYQRKGEATPEYLERQRRVYMEQGEKLPVFIQVDASQPLDKVIDEVIRLIREYNTSQGHHHSGLPAKEEIRPNEP